LRDLCRRSVVPSWIFGIARNRCIDAIRAAHAGRSTLAPEAIEALIQPAGPEPAPGPALTPRERDVLALLVEGLTNAEIAARLGVSRSTVQVHVSNILAKLGVSSRGEATTMAIQSNLLREARDRT